MTAAARTAHGGWNIYGASVGILLNESQFPRIPGDVGNANTWPFPVLYEVVPGASPDRVVRHLDSAPMLEEYLEAARRLAQRGARLITTGCGFLVLYQRQLQTRLDVPILTSSLLQVPWVAATLPVGCRVGVLTVERSSLTSAHLEAAGITPATPVTIRGMDDEKGYFTEQILGDHLDLAVDRCEAEHVQAARTMVAAYPDVGAIVLECTNMPPYAAAISTAVGLPVYDLTTMVRWALSAHVRTPFPTASTSHGIPAGVRHEPV
ncbi:MAG: aspartate/glutamate racemase family protein [Nocardioidaceae bacterium]